MKRLLVMKIKKGASQILTPCNNPTDKSIFLLIIVFPFMSNIAGIRNLIEIALDTRREEKEDGIFLKIDHDKRERSVASSLA